MQSDCFSAAAVLIPSAGADAPFTKLMMTLERGESFWSAVAEGQGASLPRRHRCRAREERSPAFAHRPARDSGVALTLATALHDAGAMVHEPKAD